MELNTVASVTSNVLSNAATPFTSRRFSTFKLLLTSALPVTINKLFIVLKVPFALRSPSITVFPDTSNVLANFAAADTSNVELNVVALETAKVEFNVEAPVTVNELPNAAAPVTSILS